jgi:hypothetical protein
MRKCDTIGPGELDLGRWSQGIEGVDVDDSELTRGLFLEIVYVDDDLIELDGVVGAGDWRGRATAYSGPTEIGQFADALLQFASGGATAVFEAGADTGIGLIALRFYRTDRSGHIACYARLASGTLPNEHRPEEVSCLSVEFAAEAWAVEQFARQLTNMADTKAGRATMAIEP